MVEIIACQCDEGYGLPHTHIGRRFVYEKRDGTEVRLDEHNVALNRSTFTAERGWKLKEIIPDSIRMWIDWKKVVEDVSRADR